MQQRNEDPAAGCSNRMAKRDRAAVRIQLFCHIDPEIFARPKKKQSIKQDLLDKLNGACVTSLMGVAFLLIFFFGGKWANSFFPTAFYLIAGGVLLAVGIGLFITYFTGKKMMANEIEAEEKGLLNKE